MSRDACFSDSYISDYRCFFRSLFMDLYAPHYTHELLENLPMKKKIYVRKWTKSSLKSRLVLALRSMKFLCASDHHVIRP